MAIATRALAHWTRAARPRLHSPALLERQPVPQTAAAPRGGGQPFLSEELVATSGRHDLGTRA
jgi:hypothetical protein